MRILEMMRKLFRVRTAFTLSLLNVYTCLLTETINLKIKELDSVLQKWIRKRNSLFYHTIAEIKQKSSEAWADWINLLYSSDQNTCSPDSTFTKNRITKYIQSEFCDVIGETKQKLFRYKRASLKARGMVKVNEKYLKTKYRYTASV